DVDNGRGVEVPGLEFAGTEEVTHGRPPFGCWLGEAGVNGVRGLVVLGIVREVSLVLHQLDRRRGAGVPQDRWTAQPARSRTTGARQSSGLWLASGFCGPAGTSLTWLPRPPLRHLSQKV